MKELVYIAAIATAAALTSCVSNDSCVCEYDNINGQTESIHFNEDDLDYYGVKNCRDLQRELSYGIVSCREE